MSTDVLFSKPTNNKARMNFKTTRLKEVFFLQALVIVFCCGKSQDRSYTESCQGVLPRLGRWRKAWWTEFPGRRWAGAEWRTVETWRKEKGQLSDLIHHLSGRRKRPRGDNRHLSVKRGWSTNWREWKRPQIVERGEKKNKTVRKWPAAAEGRKSCRLFRITVSYWQVESRARWGSRTLRVGGTVEERW